MKSTINKQQVIIEFFSVVFAVILALVLNGWRESAGLKANLEKVERSILKEAKRNNELVEESYTYRKALLNKLYSNQNLLLSVAVSDLDFDVNDNDRLKEFFKTALIFGQKEYYANIEVLQEEDKRVLVLDKDVFDLTIKNDTLQLLGLGNIILKLPDLNNQSWDMAKATSTVARMDIELVEKLVTVNSLIEAYQRTSETAVTMVYEGQRKGLIAVLEDLLNLEQKILAANSELIKRL